MNEKLKKYSKKLFYKTRILKFFDDIDNKKNGKKFFKALKTNYHDLANFNKYKEYVANYANIKLEDFDRIREETYKTARNTMVDCTTDTAQKLFEGKTPENWILINYNCQTKYKKHYNFIVNYFKDKKDIVMGDYGCGCAVQSFALFDDSNIDIKSIDLYEIQNDVADFVKNTIQNHYADKNIVWNDVLTTPLPKDKYDLITCLDVLEHLVNPTEIIKKLTDSLKTGGLLVLAAPWEVDDPAHIPEAADDFYNNGGYKYFKKHYKKLLHFSEACHISGAYKKIR